ncbi:tryptophan synthase subunit alpha [Lachnospiraceae bacterium NSJ-143]|nr:tryptophan synthase subunit alpha [Lachnospiraceae bacterium NSJ-143]
MSNIYKAFKNGKAFIGFLTGGDPSIEKTEEYILDMVRGGADIIEIGIPFSDPIAEGPVIQEANIRALKAGCTPERLFDMVGRIRLKTQVPIVFLTYLNPVFNYGYDKFFARCQSTGVDGIIIPDMPFEERGELSKTAESCGVDLISLIAPTSDDRIKQIAKEASGYVYVVSSMGVTGMRSEIKTDIKSIVDSIKSYTDVPAAVGFGINTPEQAAAIVGYSDGIIVGSAIVKIIEKYGADAGQYVYEYVKSMKDAIIN